ncbi:Ubiquitin- modifier 1 [Gaertneriomyces sp. JEL0708]|nr:Ubiquitin- modifier 1 [Gaertneriomyces sp. JEL0708]
MSRSITLEFSSGTELLFEPSTTKRQLLLPEGVETLKDLIQFISQEWIPDEKRRALFKQGDEVRPGILVLINDTDYELEGGISYQLKDGDVIVFISTLHGG